jgi:hypothetical protein
MKHPYLITGLVMLLFSTSVLSQERITVEQYIDRYKDLAIAEMTKYRIPASITLAQGILESESGNSQLAQEANNHFGIKCHKEWTGKTYHQDDDEKDECFRKYGSVEDSYRDHSEFLTTRDRYKPLFDMEVTDYKGWAYGLKAAGYATNPRYPELLIRIIEENGLEQFDKSDHHSLAGSRKPQSGSRRPATGHRPPASDIEPSSPPNVFPIFGRGGNDRIIFLNNGVKFVLAREGDDFYKIADEFGIYSWQLYYYNDMSKKDPVMSGQKVYLEKKKGKAEFESHIAVAGESMQSVSQDYGIRLKALCRMNGMDIGGILKDGDDIRLR